MLNVFFTRLFSQHFLAHHMYHHQGVFLVITMLSNGPLYIL